MGMQHVTGIADACRLQVGWTIPPAFAEPLHCPTGGSKITYIETVVGYHMATSLANSMQWSHKAEESQDRPARFICMCTKVDRTTGRNSGSGGWE